MIRRSQAFIPECRSKSVWMARLLVLRWAHCSGYLFMVKLLLLLQRHSWSHVEDLGSVRIFISHVLYWVDNLSMKLFLRVLRSFNIPSEFATCLKIPPKIANFRFSPPSYPTPFALFSQEGVTGRRCYSEQTSDKMINPCLLVLNALVKTDCAASANFEH